MRTSYPIICYVSLACLLIMYGINGYNLWTIVKSSKLEHDPLFSAWRTKFRRSSYLMVLILQTATNFKFTTLWISGWLGRKRYLARFSRNSG